MSPSLLAILKTAAPYHLLLYSVLFGTTTYQSFYNGIIAYRALPLKEFGNLQARIFPTYFRFQAIGSAILLALPPVSPVPTAFYVALGLSFATGAVNALFLGPLSNRIKAKRDEQMDIEGKSYKDPTASDTMKALNKQFGQTHGISVSLNMITFGSLLYYGVLLTALLMP
jgi:hypothetical protein